MIKLRHVYDLGFFLFRLAFFLASKIMYPPIIARIPIITALLKP